MTKEQQIQENANVDVRTENSRLKLNRCGKKLVCRLKVIFKVVHVNIIQRKITLALIMCIVARMPEDWLVILKTYKRSKER